MCDISIVVPVKNEAENLKRLFERTDAALVKTKLRYELIVVDGGSIDNSYSVARSLANTFPILLVKQKSKGKAGAIIEGAKQAKGDKIIMIDADLQYPPEAIVEMAWASKKFDVVVARRNRSKEELLRKIAGKIHELIYCRILFGLKYDVQSGLKLFPKSLIDLIDEEDYSNWTLDLALLLTAKRNKLKLGEIEIAFANRYTGKSKVNVYKSFIEHTKSVIKLKIKEQSNKFKSSCK